QIETMIVSTNQSDEAPNHIGYKKCSNNRIVKLEIIGDNNERRKYIVDHTHAKHRCSRATVIDIYNMDNKDEHYTEAYSIYNDSFVYQVGETVKPELFDSNIDNVCGGGIHYFLSEETAYHY